MILPVRTNIWPRRTPYVNYALIAINVIIFLITYSPVYNPYTREQVRVFLPWVSGFELYPRSPQLYQFITYAFLHGSWPHIIGNMFFLYLFGNNVSDKLGTARYLIFYFLGAIMSGLGHIAIYSLTQPANLNSPLVGASGAIAAVTGAYLVLFPQTLITVLYWFFVIGTIEIPAIYFIAFKMIIIDNVMDRFTQNVAYDAHLAGYAFGIAATLLLLITGLVKQSGFDLWSMIKLANRRRQYRDAVAGGFEPFSGVRTKKIKVREVSKPTEQPSSNNKITQLRSEINSRIIQRNLSAAAQSYLQLNELDNQQVLPKGHLLDIANQLASENKHLQAAQTYEKFIRHYPNYEYIEQVELMLGLLYSRYLKEPEPAIFHLNKAKEKLTEPGQLKMCKDELEKLQNL
jgi:membrane associated rhomboid family serine protease